MSSHTRRAATKHEQDRIGLYLIREEVGRGSFATVYRGSRVDNGELVAVKAVVRNKLTPKLLENLEKEILILKRLKHRNIVDLKDCLKTDTHIYLIMAYCSAGDLSTYIKKRGQIPSLNLSNQGLTSDSLVQQNSVLYPHPKQGGLNETIVRCFLGQLMSAIKFLHRQDVIHRDLKPQNLLLQPAEVSDLAAGHPPGIPIIKVADFGFARWLPTATLAETLCGSPLYMAPEILRYEKYDAAVDLWSVGAVMYEMLLGKPPFRAQNHIELLKKIDDVADRIRFPDEKRPKEGAPKPTPVASDLKTLIRGLLKRNPLDRISFEQFFAETRLAATSGSASHLSDPESFNNHTQPQRLPPAIPTSSGSKALDQTKSSDSSRVAPRDPSNPLEKTSVLPSNDFKSEPLMSDTPPAFARRSASHNEISNRLLNGRDAIVRKPSNGTPTTVETPQRIMANQDQLANSNESLFGKDYVVVEKRNVEINALADELAEGHKKDSLVTKQTARGFLKRQASSPLGSTPYPPTYHPSATPVFALPRPNSTHPYSLSSSPHSFPTQHQQSTLDRISSPLGLVGTQGAALFKVINVATHKIFGSPQAGLLVRKTSTRKAITRSGPISDSEEDKVLQVLENMGQKALVIFDFADSRLMKILPPTPMTSTPSSTPPTSLGTPTYHAHLAMREQSSNPFSPIPTNRMRRTSSSSSSERIVLSGSIKAEEVAAEALVLYLKSLMFITRGIERARIYWAQRSNEGPASADFNDAVQWFRDRFNECFDKAEFAKQKCNEKIPESAGDADRLIYDRSLELSRAAAVSELNGENITDCETAYETALWLLYSIIEEESSSDSSSTTPTTQTTKSILDTQTDDENVKKFIDSIQNRLKSLRKKYSVNK